MKYSTDINDAQMHSANKPAFVAQPYTAVDWSDEHVSVAAYDGLVLTEERLVVWCDDVCAGMEKAGLLNDFALYESLIAGLRGCSNVDLVPISALLEERRCGSVRLSLRHDVDAGVWCAPRMARALAKNSIPGVFYFLHTAAYYGFVSPIGSAQFIRQPVLSGIVRAVVSTDCEVGLHNDALHVFKTWHLDGCQALEQEVGWLREHGAKVASTSAHNSGYVYGGENFELFRGLAAWGRDRLQDGTQLGVVSQETLGIAFEANYPLPSKKRPAETELVHYHQPHAEPIRNQLWLENHFLNNPYFISAYDIDAWLTGHDRWFIADRRGDGLLKDMVTTEQVLSYLSSIENGATVVVNIHPDYFA